MKGNLPQNRRLFTAAALLITAALMLGACGKDSAAKTEGNNASNTSGNAGAVSGSSGSGSGSSADAGKAAQDLASQYGVDMPDGIVSAADPDAVYEAGNMIQFNGIELYIAMDNGSDWIDSKTGLSDGMKYISIPVKLDDYGANTVKSIPDPSHYYLTEARDADGNILDLGGRLQPVTDMPGTEIRMNAETYYRESGPMESGGMDRWLLYKVPEAVREVTIACWLNDQFTEHHDAAFRLSIAENQDKHIFEGWDPLEIQKAVNTTDRPELEEFAWYTPYLFDHGFSYSVPVGDPEYNGYEYLGGWKCYLIRDDRARGNGMDAHLLNVYLENFEPEDDDEGLGWMDIRLDWYLGFDEAGNVIDESGLPDTVCRHEQFYYNRMENEDGSYPFFTFGYDYVFDRAVGRCTYTDADGNKYLGGIVRKDGFGIWMLDEKEVPRTEFTTLPGTNDVPLPASLVPASSGSAAPAGASGKDIPSSQESNIAVTGGTDSASTGGALSMPGSADPAQSPASSGGAAASSGSTSAGTGSQGAQTAGTKAPTLDDFNWYFEDDFPIDGNVLTELQDLGGSWKGLLNVVTAVDGGDQCRIMVCHAEVQYMGYKVTVLLNPKETHEFMVSDPSNIKTEKLDTAGNIVMNGDWVDDPGYIDVTSETSTLRLLIYDFVEAGGRQYALGSVYNGDTEIGEVALVR